MKTPYQMALAVVLFAGPAAPAANPPTAAEIMAAAKAQASAQGKDIFLIFGASW